MGNPFRADERRLEKSDLMELDKEELVEMVDMSVYEAKCPDCGKWNIYKFIDMCNQSINCECGTKYSV